MANNVLGEVEVKILEMTVTLRPTFEGIIEMEQRSRKTLARLASMFAVGDAGLTEIAAVCWGGLVGARDKNSHLPTTLTFEEFGAMIMQHGFTKLFPACAKLVGAAYSGKPIDEIEAGSKKKKAESKSESEQS